MKRSRLSKSEKKKIRRLVSHLKEDIREAKAGIRRDVESISQLKSMG